MDKDECRELQILIMVTDLKHQLAFHEPIDIKKLSDLMDMRRALNESH